MTENEKKYESSSSLWQRKLHQIIFEAETPLGKAFDLILIWFILLSVLVIALESIQTLRNEYGPIFFFLEWFFTIIFTIEYLLRILCLKKARNYIFSFYGIIDFLSILPTYLSLFIGGAHSLMVIRILRVSRIFRLLKLTRYTSEAKILSRALRASRHKITVFLVSVLSLVILVGTAMYLIEGESAGFTSIPRSMYWAIVTMTTVGYGDLVPQSDLGQALASFLMITGYGIIAVPTGIVTAEIATAQKEETTKTCPSCLHEGLSLDSKFCKFCGSKLY